MKIGLVLGKFMPLHKGHVNLINFASIHCDRLIVLCCASNTETISGELRLKWIKDVFADNPKVEPVLMRYNENELPNTSESSYEVSKLWGDYLKTHFPETTHVFTTEKYGDYLAEIMNVTHLKYIGEKMISATQIRENPYKYWDYIPVQVQPYFVKKVCLVGTESTGKTTFAQLLAKHYNATCLYEVARDIVGVTDECTFEQLERIAEEHAKAINKAVETAQRILFVDTDITITKSYAKFLFNSTLDVPRWIEDANKFNLYLYLDKDAPYIQDGTRLDVKQRNKLDESHKREMEASDKHYVLINGELWSERLAQCISQINRLIWFV